ncbi:MAG: LysR family transcriptional regulator [Rhizobiaceae bacterium]|nr:LysR family transcriptional regulator [Rhizobiaceae bacterium]
MGETMDWDKLRIFHAVAEAGSFTHAGNKLNLSQSAISRQVSSLENDLGVPLFHRHARGLVMTEQGETLYDTAHDVLLKLDAVKSKLTDSTEKPEGKLRVTTTVGLGTGWLTTRIHEFIELYPEVQLDLILADEEIDLITREADCAIRLQQPKNPDLIQRKLFTVHLHVYAAPAYLKRYGQPASLDDLEDHRIIAYGENIPGYLTNVNWLLHAGMEGHRRRHASFQVNNLRALRRVCEEGTGIAVLPDYIVEDRHALVQLFPDMEVPEFDTYFCYPQELKHAAKLRVFRDFLISKARNWKY